MVDCQLIDGRALAAEVKADLTTRVATLRGKGREVRLDAVLVGDDRAAGIYAANQRKACSEVGITYMLHTLDGDADHQEVAARIQDLNQDPAVTAIMVHLPLPSRVDADEIQSIIAPGKDVEGVNPANIGNIVFGRRSLVPCTALAVMEMIESTDVPLRGSRAVCVGASNILLMQAEATVISTNEYTPNQATLTRDADILVTAAGVPGLITPDIVKRGAVVIDVGINRLRDETTGKTRTVGDVDFEAVKSVAGFLTPVPGGVGPMTVAMLLRNTVDAAE